MDDVKQKVSLKRQKISETTVAAVKIRDVEEKHQRYQVDSYLCVCSELRQFVQESVT